MARTLIDKTSREEHIVSRLTESRMIIEQASLKAKKALREEDIKLKPSTICIPAINVKKSVKRTANTINGNNVSLRKENKGTWKTDFDVEVEVDAKSKKNMEASLIENPSRSLTSNIRDLTIQRKSRREKNEQNRCLTKKNRSLNNRAVLGEETPIEPKTPSQKLKHD